MFGGVNRAGGGKWTGHPEHGLRWGGTTRRAKVQVGGIGCARYPTPARFLPLLSLLKPKLAFQASQRNLTQQEHSLPNLHFEGEKFIVVLQETKDLGSRVNV